MWHQIQIHIWQMTCITDTFVSAARVKRHGLAHVWEWMDVFFRSCSSNLLCDFRIKFFFIFNYMTTIDVCLKTLWWIVISNMKYGYLCILTTGFYTITFVNIYINFSTSRRYPLIGLSDEIECRFKVFVRNMCTHCPFVPTIICRAWVNETGDQTAKHQQLPLTCMQYKINPGFTVSS